MLGDHHALYLTGSLTNLTQLHVAQMSFDVELAHVTVATVYLQAVVADSRRSLAGEELGCGRFERVALAPVGFPRSPVNQELRCIQLSLGVGEHEADGLQVRNRLAEGRPLFGVIDRHLQSTTSQPERHRGNRDTPAVEYLHGVAEAAVDFAQALSVTHANVVESDLDRVTRTAAVLLEFLAGDVASSLRFDDERRDPALGGRLEIRPGKHHAE